MPDALDPADGKLAATLIKDLYARHYADLSDTSSSTEARNRAAAFAMVIWEITHQDSSATTAAGVLADLDLTAGNARFNSSSSVNSLASGWLNGLGGGTGDFQNFTKLIGLTDPTTQDFLIVAGPIRTDGVRRPGRGPNPPPTLIAVACGCSRSMPRRCGPGPHRFCCRSTDEEAEPAQTRVGIEIPESGPR